MFGWRLIPKEEKFFTEFIALADEILKGARLLEDMLATDPPRFEHARAIKDVEHRCDLITHEILQRLNRTFVTPIDREDIYALAKSLDDVIDAIDGAAAVIRRYQLQTVRWGVRELSRLIVSSTEQMRRGTAALEKHDGVHECAVEANRLENEADDVHDEALRRLFEEETDALLVVKWKELIDLLEQATDRCEDVADVLESVVVKHT